MSAQRFLEPRPLLSATRANAASFWDTATECGVCYRRKNRGTGATRMVHLAGAALLAEKGPR